MMTHRSIERVWNDDPPSEFSLGRYTYYVALPIRCALHDSSLMHIGHWIAVGINVWPSLCVEGNTAPSSCATPTRLNLSMVLSDLRTFVRRELIFEVHVFECGTMDGPHMVYDARQPLRILSPLA